MIESEVSGVLPVTQIKSADWCIAKHLDPFNIEVYCQNKSLLLHKLCYSLHKHVLMSNKVYGRSYDVLYIHMVHQPEKNQHDVKVNKIYCQASKYKNKYIQLILLQIVQFIYCRYTYSILFLKTIRSGRVKKDTR